MPEEMSRWHAVENLFASVCQRYGYGEIRVPTFEQTELFARGVVGLQILYVKRCIPLRIKADAA